MSVCLCVNFWGFAPGTGRAPSTTGIQKISLCTILSPKMVSNYVHIWSTDMLFVENDGVKIIFVRRKSVKVGTVPMYSSLVLLTSNNMAPGTNHASSSSPEERRTMKAQSETM